jgi:hypothetical protein
MDFQHQKQTITMIEQKDKDYDLFWVQFFDEDRPEDRQVMVIPVEFGPKYYMTVKEFESKYK